MVKLAIEDQSSDDIVSDFILELESIVEGKFNLIKENISLKVFGEMINSMAGKINSLPEESIS